MEFDIAYGPCAMCVSHACLIITSPKINLYTYLQMHPSWETTKQHKSTFCAWTMSVVRPLDIVVRYRRRKTMLVIGLFAVVCLSSPVRLLYRCASLFSEIHSMCLAGGWCYQMPANMYLTAQYAWKKSWHLHSTSCQDGISTDAVDIYARVPNPNHPNGKRR